MVCRDRRASMRESYRIWLEIFLDRFSFLKVLEQSTGIVGMESALIYLWEVVSDLIGWPPFRAGRCCRKGWYTIGKFSPRWGQMF